MRLGDRLGIPIAGCCMTLLLAAGPPPPTDSSLVRAIDPALTRAIDAYCRPLVDAGHLSGQLLVARGGRVVAERSYGFGDLELRAPVTPETRFCIASVTKPMTTIVAIQLIEEKRLALGDPLAKWFPDFPSADSITVEHLLRHRSGIPHEAIPDSEATRPLTTAQVVERAKRNPLDFPPGSRSSYSSGGYSVLAAVLERASGKSYADLLQERIFGPLGMTSSSHPTGRAMLPGRARSYVPGLHGIENAPLQDYSFLVGAGSVWSNARDLHRFVQAIVTGKLGASTRTSYVRNGRLSFNGRTNGFMAWAAWDSATGVEVVFAGNVHTGAPDLVKSAVPELAAGRKPAPFVLPGRVPGPPVSELERYEGTYWLFERTRLEFRVRDGVLHSNDWVLLPIGEREFFSPRDYGRLTPVLNADGRVERFDWKVGGETYPVPREADRPR